MGLCVFIFCLSCFYTFWDAIPYLFPNSCICICVYNVYKAQGGLIHCTRDATFSLAIILNREMLSSSVDAGFVLALPFYHGDLEPDCVEVSVREGSGGRV